MLKLLTAEQIKKADAYTIANEPISSIELMERASKAFVSVFSKRYPNQYQKITVVCGQGNNGGDGLAIARLLKSAGYQSVRAIYLDFSAKQNDDNRINLERLKQTDIQLEIISEVFPLNLDNIDIVIDAILGSGLNKPLTEAIKQIVAAINKSSSEVVSIDVPTGFLTEGELSANYNGIEANFVISFQLPKINFFFPESAMAIEDFEIVDIGLSLEFIKQQVVDFHLITESDIQSLIKPRKKFSHKGTYGHVLIGAGATNTMGAALLCAHACLKTGAGLTTLICPKDGSTALNVALPEVMAFPLDVNTEKSALEKYNALAFGPGWGFTEMNKDFLEKAISTNKPLVLDADALTILSENKYLIAQLPKGTILTPHMKEFDRLFGEHTNWWQRVLTARTQAEELGIVIILKNQYTFIALRSGDIRINTTGNPAMAQGGMGDTLTGIIVSLLAQKYNAEEAAILGVYLHGKAGDILAETQHVVSASQIADEIPEVMKSLIESSC